MNRVDDRELAERATRGEAAATEALVTHALPVVRGLARRLTGDPEEGDVLAQDALVIALEKLESYRGQAAFSTWVCAIALRRHAGAKRAQAAEGRRRGAGALRAVDPVATVAERDSARRLLLLVDQLPATHRDALLARATADSPAEAARVLHVSPAAFRTRLHRARLALRARLEATYPDMLEEVGHAQG